MGSEMCIRDRILTAGEPIVLKNKNDRGWGKVLQRSQYSYFSLYFPLFQHPFFLSFFRTKKIASLHHHALFWKNRIVEQQMNELHLIVP